MDKKEQILHYHRIDGLSQREIARRVGVCRKTVKRYITEYEAQVLSDPEDGANMCLASKPKYPSRLISYRFICLFSFNTRRTLWLMCCSLSVPVALPVMSCGCTGIS